ncbi:guanine nucleotide binding protein, alpha subunit [Metschnikowia bicuspidata]|uniref:Guanine nucleotide binding protein, alpha subunit n=1 Tax=Metschnikowia bicuspidata TaxID=27322 RepID=A0A4V1J3P0_9ASCO|nr:guanine nucleotide binding protein, alpha subunit [Metschnikowia bicuspidata]
MGCFGSTLSEQEALLRQQKQRSQEIDKVLMKRKKEEANLIRIVLLGAGDSGKSTILKQMRILHDDYFTDMERYHYTHILWLDMIESMKTLIFNARRLRIPLDCDRPDSPLILFKRIIVDTERQHIARAITELWTRDRGIRRCFDQRNKFQLAASAKHYFEIAHKLKDRQYRCTDEDILMGRIKSTGISEHIFQVRDTVLKIFDAGGQRSERRKWIHHFLNMNAIIFVVAVLEYDEVLYEDARVNRMEESMSVFGSICNSRWFANTAIILFLNKTDLLKEKLYKSPFTDYCPEYDGDPLNVDQVIDYYERKILSLNRYPKPIYVHRTCATNTESMAFVLEAVTDLIVQMCLARSGLI